MDIPLVIYRVLIIGFFSLFFFFRIEIINRLPYRLKKPATEYFKEMKFTIGNWWKTILVPILVISVCFFIGTLFNLTVFHPFPQFSIDATLWAYFIEVGILAPFSEQILQCVFLSVIFFIIGLFYKNRWIITGLNIAALTFISYILASVHFDPITLNWLMRFFLFMIFGAIYYLNERNMFPSVVAHSAWNLLSLL